MYPWLTGVLQDLLEIMDSLSSAGTLRSIRLRERYPYYDSLESRTAVIPIEVAKTKLPSGFTTLESFHWDAHPSLGTASFEAYKAMQSDGADVIGEWVFSAAATPTFQRRWARPSRGVYYA